MKRILFKSLIGLLSFLLLMAIVVAVILSLSLPAAPVVPEESGSIWIKNALVVDLKGDSTIQQDILIENGQISKMTAPDSLAAPDQARVLDATGKYIIPGLWDMHTHLSPQFTPQLTFPLFIAAGVTNIRDLGGYGAYEDKKAWDEQIRSNKMVGPRIQGIGAIFLASLQSEEQAQQIVDQFPGQAPDFIKVYNAVLPEYYFPLMEMAKNKNIPVLGHKPRAVNAIEAARAGHKSFEHARLFLFECYPGAAALREAYHDRYSGISEGGRLDDTQGLRQMIDNHSEEMFMELVSVMKENKTWFCPTHITRKMDAFAADEAFRTDPRLKYIHRLQRMGWKGDADGMTKRYPGEEGQKTVMDFYLKGLELTGKASRAGLKILAGTDANDTYCFPGLSLHDELAELVKAGLSPAEALRAATLYPAEYFGLESTYGSIDNGKIADLLILNDNPLNNIENTKSIQTVIFNGQIYHREKLDELLEGVEKMANSGVSTVHYLWKEIQ